MTPDQIMSHTRDDAGCAVWMRSCCNGHPAYRDPVAGKMLLVRRVLWTLANGPIKPGHIIRMTCGTPKCVDVEHMVQTTYGRLAKELGALGIMSGVKRSASIARTKRAGYQAKLTDAAVRDIRTSNRTGVALAAEHGVAQATISKIQKHQLRREFTGNPFAGLLS